MEQQRCSLLMPNAQLTLFSDRHLDGVGIGRTTLLRAEVGFHLDLSNFNRSIAILYEFLDDRLSRSEPVRLDELREPIVSAITLRFANSASAEKCLKVVRQFLDLQIRKGAEYLSDITPEDIQDFYWLAVKRGGHAKPSASTAANRQWAVRVLFETVTSLGMWDGSDFSGESITRDLRRSLSPASVQELQRIKEASRNVLVPTGEEFLVALSLAGGSAGEIALATIGDVDFANSRISFRGPNQRTNPLEPWSHEVLESADQIIRVGQPLVVSPGLHLARATHSVTVRLNRIVANAGFPKRRNLTGASIRLGVAKQILDREGLEASAQFLGNQSLDLTARSLGYDWRGRL